MELSLAFSPCPNDTFIFDALVHGRIDTAGYRYRVELADILHLNEMAIAGKADIIKVSYQTYGAIRNRYTLLEAGSALGRGCGPLLISKKPLTVEEIVARNLPVGIPGRNTTANLLLSYFAPGITNRREMIFSEIMPALEKDEIAAGVIIHENRFTYQQHGLRAIQDLGAYWERQTSLPIPLGGIVARTELGPKVIAELNRQLRESVAYAFANPQASAAYVGTHAQEMDPEVMQAHINLYVNEFSLALGEEGHQAINQLLAVGDEMGLYTS